MENQDTPKESNSVTKVFAYGITGTVLFAICTAIYSLFTDCGDMVLRTLIPLWGTWVGTVPAFYFCKNNFDAAAKSYQTVNV